MSHSLFAPYLTVLWLGARAAWRALRTHRTGLLFWPLIAAATWVLIAPIWVGPMAPMTDFGGHASMVDVWARMEEVELYSEMFARRDAWVPNTLVARVCGWLYPWLEPLAALRWVTTALLASTVAAMVGTARAFDRSPWVVFLALPFLWNMALHWGMVNYLAVFPFFFAALACARMAGQTGDWRWGVGLAAAGLASYLAHGLGAPFTVGASSFVLFWSLNRPRYLPMLLASVPAGAAFWWWKNAAQQGGGLPGDGFWDMLEKHARWHDWPDKWNLFVDHGLNATSANTEYKIFMLLVAVWLVAMAVSRAAPTSRDDRSAASGFLGYLERIWFQIQDNTLVLCAVCLWGAFWIFPSFIDATNIATRVAPLFLMTAALLPRLPERHVVAMASVAAALGISLWFGGYVDQTFRDFSRREMEPIAELAEYVEPQSRVECFAMRGFNATPVQATPLNHTCPAIFQVRTQSFGGLGFPGTGFNPVKFREGHQYTELGPGGYNNLGKLQQWDYLVTDGPSPRPPKQMAELVATASADAADAPVWHLYRVRDRQRSLSADKQTGGDGGVPFKWPCAEGRALAGLRGTTNSKVSVSTLRASCRDVVMTSDASKQAAANGKNAGDESNDASPEPEDARKRLRLTGKEYRGPRIGDLTGRRGHFNAQCPEGEFVVGLTGRSGFLVDYVSVLCAPVHTQPGDPADDAPAAHFWNPSEVHKVDGGGGPGGGPFKLKCPSHSVVTTLVGRNGAEVDAVGIGCTRLDEIAAELGHSE